MTETLGSERTLSIGEAITRLMQCDNSLQPFQFLPVILKWLARETSLEARLRVACLLRGAIPGELLPELCRAGLADPSPSQRVAVVKLLARLDAGVWRPLLTEAVQDEPDQEIRAEMTRMLAGDEGLPTQ